MVNTGLSEVIGSWKIIAMRAPRTSRIATSGASRFRSALEQDLAASRRVDRQMLRQEPHDRLPVTVFPQPDSPTMPNVSPREDVEGDVVHGGDDPRIGAEARGQVAHLEDGFFFGSHQL